MSAQTALVLGGCMVGQAAWPQTPPDKALWSQVGAFGTL